MEKRKELAGIFLVCFLVISFLILPFFTGEVGAREGWKPWDFEPGQSFTYLIKAEKDGTETLGEVSILIYPAGDYMIEMVLKGELGGEYFEVYAEAEKGQTEDLFIALFTQMMWEVPELVLQTLMHTFLQPWMETPLDNAQLSMDWVWEEDDEDEWDEWDDDDFWMGVIGRETYGGVEGFLIGTDEEVEFDYVFQICISPDIPLPIMAGSSSFVEDHDLEAESFYAELLSYEMVALGDMEPVVRKEPEGTVLDDLVEYFADNGLEIGERQMKAYGMLGAIAGFGLIVEGDEIELYLFDPETASEETMEYLEAARETGKFNFKEMGMEIPVVLNGYIMLTGLEFGTFYEHPEKDLIVEIFQSF